MKNQNNFIVIKRIISALIKTPILCHRTKIIFSLWLKTWGEGREFGEFSTKEICHWTKLDRNRVSELIAEMIHRQIFQQKKEGHRRVLALNKYYSQWILTVEIQPRRGTPMIPVDYDLEPPTNRKQLKRKDAHGPR